MKPLARMAAPPLPRYDLRFLTAAAGYPGLANVLLGFLLSHLSAMLYWVRVCLSLRSGESGGKDEGKRGGEGERRKVILRQEKKYRDRFISPFPCLAKLLTVKLSMNNVYCQ